MDHSTLRSLMTLISFLVFVCIAFWAWSARNRSRFDEAANLPFADDEIDRRSQLPHGANK